MRRKHTPPRRKPGRGAAAPPRRRKVAIQPPEQLSPAAERVWALAGLALAGLAGLAGIAVAERDLPRIKLSGASRLALVGDEYAFGLEPHLSRMARDARVGFNCAVYQGRWTGAELYQQRSLREVLAEPADILLVICQLDQAAGSWLQDPQIRPLLRAVAEAHDKDGRSAEVVWGMRAMSPMLRRWIQQTGAKVLPAPPPLEEGPTGWPTAASYATWAGAIWSWLV